MSSVLTPFFVTSVPLGDISLAKIGENKKESSSFENAKSVKELQGSGTKSTDGTNSKENFVKESHFKHLSPNDLHKCDGYGCALEALFVMDGNFFCQSHFDSNRKSCYENGFDVIEDHEGDSA